jgi:hypothetical protein
MSFLQTIKFINQVKGIPAIPEIFKGGNKDICFYWQLNWYLSEIKGRSKKCRYCKPITRLRDHLPAAPKPV